MSYWFRSGLPAAAAAGAAALLSRSSRRTPLAPLVLRAALVPAPRVLGASSWLDDKGRLISSTSLATSNVDGDSSTSTSTSSAANSKENENENDSPSSPTAPFHLAVPVADISAARRFYGAALGCPEGRSAATWVDFNLYGHQLVCHEVKGYDARTSASSVDGDPVPVPHFGLALDVAEFHELASRVARAGIEFELEPHLRFKGQPGEQWTMFFRDPSGNALEFKAMTRPENLFAKYVVTS